ncbi:MAG: mechanosensitive ion channel [Chromatiaceae bacterium]|nr:mechanosensitive ion channel [Chromatiaceae bacterium]
MKDYLYYLGGISIGLRSFKMACLMFLFVSIQTSVMAQEEPTREEIRVVQQLLLDDGYIIDSVDGLLGAQTIRTIRKFQRENDLDVSPYIDVSAIEDIKGFFQGRSGGEVNSPDELDSTSKSGESSESGGSGKPSESGESNELSESAQTTQKVFSLPLQVASLESGYHEFSNEELLKQATEIYRQEESHFNAKRRLLQQLRTLYRQAEQANEIYLQSIEQQPVVILKDAVASDTEAPGAPGATGLAIAVQGPQVQEQLSIVDAEQQLEGYQNQVKDISRQIEILEQVMAQNEVTQQAAEAFSLALGRLHVIVLEIDLRLADGTFKEEVPPFLTESLLGQQSQRLETLRERLVESQEANREQLQILQTHLGRIQQSVAEAETALTAMREQQEQLGEAQRFEEAYRDKNDQALSQELTELENERISLQGGVRLSLLGLQRGLAQLDGIEEALEPLSSDAMASLDSGLSASETQESIDALKALITGYESRLVELNGYEERLAEIAELTEIAKAETGILQEHLKKMRLLAELLETRGAALGKDVDLDRIAQYNASIQESVQEIDAISQGVTEQSAALETRLEETRLAHVKANQRLADLEQTLASARQAQEWQQELTELDGEGLIARFVSDAETLVAQRQTLDEQRQVIGELSEQAAALRKTIDTFTDPLVKMSDSSVQQEKQRIQETLYDLSGLESPATSGAPLATVQPNAEASAAADETKADSEESEQKQVTEQDAVDAQQPGSEGLSADVAGLKAFQNLLSTRQQNGQARQEDRTQLIEVLNALEKAQAEFIDALSEIHRLSLQQYATAVELKKQLGRGDLAPEQAPEGLIGALAKAPIEALEAELKELINRRSHVRLRLSRLAAEDPAQTERDELAETLQSLVGQRLDLLADIQRLEDERTTDQEQLTEGERQRLEQQAENRMRTGSGFLESALGFLPSERAEELTELMRSHYQELVMVESKQALLATEQEKVVYLLQLVRDDQQTVSDYLPMLRAQLQALEREQEGAWVRLRAQFQPDEAEKLLADYAERTGEQLELVPAILEQDRAEFVEEASNQLLSHHAQILALQQWIALFEQRQVDTLVREIALYQEREGEISALDLALQRQVKRLLGHTDDELAALAESQRPSTQVEKAYFLEGELGVEHEQRTQARLRALLKVVVEILAIIGLAWLLIAGVKRLVDRKVRDLEMSGAPESTHTLFALSFGFAAFRILVLVLAFMLVLSSLGFNIGVILAGLGIGGFAIAIAAKETLSNLIGGITLFVERPFRIGDIIQISNDIKLGETEFGRVESVSWRTTRIANVMNYNITMPNSRVAESAIINYTHQMPLRDFTHVYVSPAYDVRKVLLLITAAVDECQLIRQDMQKQILAVGTEVAGEMVLTKYEVRWYTDVTYIARARVLTEFWDRISQKFSASGVPLEYVARRSTVEPKSDSSNRDVPNALLERER